MSAFLYFEENWLILIMAFLAFLLFVIFLKYQKLKEELNFVKKQILKARTKREIKKEINQLKRVITALETLFKEDLLPEKFYIKCKEKLQETLILLKEEL